MDSQALIDIGRQALEAVLMIASPVLLVALAVGLVIGVLQAATQIQEMTLSFIPKLFAIVITLGVLGGWMMGVLVDFTKRLISSIPALLA